MKDCLKLSFIALLFCMIAGCSHLGTVSTEDSSDNGTDMAKSELRVGGDDAAISGFILPVKETFEEEHRGVSLSIVRNGKGGGLADLLKGDVDAFVSVHSLPELIHTAAQAQMVIDPKELQSTTVGKNDTVIFLNSKNSIRKLTRKQLRSIFSGKTTNWKQLSGANRAIVVVWNGSAAAENDKFVNDVLNSAPFASKLLTVDSFEEVRKRVMETPGAIGVAPSGYIVAGIKVPNAPVSSTPVIVVTKGEPTQRVKYFTELLKDLEFLQ